MEAEQVQVQSGWPAEGVVERKVGHLPVPPFGSLQLLSVLSVAVVVVVAAAAAART